MQLPKLHSVMVIFVLFFGIGCLDALAEGNWPLAAFWLIVGSVFFILGGRKDKVA